MTARRIPAGRHEVALHTIHDAPGTPLLLLHALGGSSADWGADGGADGGAGESAWPGPVYALDFAGHGESSWLVGGGYSPEFFAADADKVVAETGPCHVAGAGIGAYVALLLAGARPNDVAAALLLPGKGVAGVTSPDIHEVLRRSKDALAAFEAPREEQAGTDPMVSMVETDARPIEYARAFARRARRLILAPRGASIGGWWDAIASMPEVTVSARSGNAISLAAELLRDAPLPTGTADR